MAWSWSHTAEAYADARENLNDLDKDKLEIIFAEWKAYNEDEPHSFDEVAYKNALEEAALLDFDSLFEWIWNRAEDQATCDNGGWNAWVCPYGCHTVAFDREAAAK